MAGIKVISEPRKNEYAQKERICPSKVLSSHRSALWAGQNYGNDAGRMPPMAHDVEVSSQGDVGLESEDHEGHMQFCNRVVLYSCAFGYGDKESRRVEDA
ncbi:hypothetical protein EVAR_26071_1 [Eumeta japonica]|uniref:Uncharacterized protein n=1 Tax=Eumeta variegata TaxID=151549 RepID=A0A4C1VR39_EUMVA|nr:hypothetical protein EVAR_26071_1 [Eumeta japonica]